MKRLITLLTLAILPLACTQANTALEDAAKAQAQLEELRGQVVHLMTEVERIQAEGKARCDAALLVLRQLDAAAPYVCAFVPADNAQGQEYCAQQDKLTAAVRNVEKACGLIGGP